MTRTAVGHPVLISLGPQRRRRAPGTGACGARPNHAAVGPTAVSVPTLRSCWRRCRGRLRPGSRSRPRRRRSAAVVSYASPGRGSVARAGTVW